jgi:hypothetical protein
MSATSLSPTRRQLIAASATAAAASLLPGDLNTRPQTLGYALADSPVAMLAFFYDKFSEWTYGRDPEKALTRDEILDDVTLYWLTNTGTSSSRSYWDAAQGGGGPFNAVDHEGPGRRDDLPW